MSPGFNWKGGSRTLIPYSNRPLVLGVGKQVPKRHLLGVMKCQAEKPERVRQGGSMPPSAKNGLRAVASPPICWVHMMRHWRRLMPTHIT
jgi:hypothetical protein